MKIVTTLELSDQAMETLDELVDFMDKTPEEVVQEALHQLSHSVAGTSPLSEEEDPWEN